MSVYVSVCGAKELQGKLLWVNIWRHVVKVSLYCCQWYSQFKCKMMSALWLRVADDGSGARRPLPNALTILTAKLLLSAVNYSDLFSDQFVRYAGDYAPTHSLTLHSLRRAYRRSNQLVQLYVRM